MGIVSMVAELKPPVSPECLLRQEKLLAGGDRLHQRDQVGPDPLGRIAARAGAGFPQRVEISLHSAQAAQ